MYVLWGAIALSRACVLMHRVQLLIWDKPDLDRARNENTSLQWLSLVLTLSLHLSALLTDEHLKKAIHASELAKLCSCAPLLFLLSRG